MADLDVPIAIRRTRRSNGGGGVAKQDEPGESTSVLARVPKTPRRCRKGVRFSEPASLSSGLTPMVRRTYLDMPRQQQQPRRRASTPAAFRSSSSNSRSAAPAPAPAPRLASTSTMSTSHVLHQTRDGRVERRLRRTHLRNLLHKLDQEKRRKARAAQAQIEQLKAEIGQRDREIYELRNATVVIDTERIWELEEQVGRLRDELAQRPVSRRSGSRAWCDEEGMNRGDEHGMYGDGAGRDPFSAAGEDGYAGMTTMMMGGQDDDGDYDYDDDGGDDDDRFGDETMAHLVASTPTRMRSSFPTPPATSPLLTPTTPCSRRVCLPTTPSLRHTHAGVQVRLADPAKQQLEEEVSSLQREVGKLTATLDSYTNLGARLKQQLAEVAPAGAGLAGAGAGAGAGAEQGDRVLEGKIAALLQTTAESTGRVAQLSRAIAQLGFPGGDAGEMMAAMASGFRAARLELEYLTPGEVALPLTSHGAQVLDLLLVRLRALAAKSSEDDDAIDEYHELEQSLRKQLDARVSALDEVRGALGKAEEMLGAQTRRAQELEVANERLRGAVDSYVRDMAELEALVQRTEAEAGEKEAAAAGLEQQLADALRQTAALQQQVSAVQDSSTRHVVSLNRRHGRALALRDARVLELRAELDRVNASLRGAHESICALRVQKGGLQTQRDAEQRQRRRAERAVDAIKAELQRVLQLSQQFLSDSDSGSDSGGSHGGSDQQRQQPGHDTVQCAAAPSPPEQHRVQTEVDNGPSAHASEDKKRTRKRRFDSGLGFLEEDQVDLDVS
ncbi:hypothetical protein E4U43_006225 [Claviceps pusilla]|uniref:Uncharacterized protein n=1 Tax=Claviceps pusilla TaxID=123648 RepID=A0A9P7NEV8_9HYPO|nr:hypothetical protein E4U43_006225 [Claviceps pusilla]